MAKKAMWTLFEDRYNQVSDSWRTRRQAYEDDYRQIRGADRLDHDPKPWGAKVNSQLTHTQLNTFTDFTMAGLMSTAPWLYAECREPYRLLNTEAPATEEFHKRLKDIRFYRTMRRWIRVSGSFGLGIAKLTGAGKPTLTLVDPGNFAWQPGCHDFRHHAAWVIERYNTLTIGDVKALRRSGIFKGSLKNLYSWAQSTVDDATAERYEARHGYPEPVAERDDDTKVELYDMVTPDRIVTVHRDSETILRDIPNPYGYIPYYDLTAYFEVFDVHGFALPELLADLQDEINTTRRQRIDIASLEASPMMAVARSCGVDPNRITVRPGGVLSVNDPSSDVKWLQAQDTTQGLLAVEMVLERDADRVTGVQAQTRGERGEQMKATVASIINANVNVRFQVNINDMLDYPLRDLFADFVALSIMDDGPVAVPAQEWMKIVEAAEYKKLDLVPQIESYVGSGLQKTQVMMNVLPALVPVTAPQGIGEFVKEMLRPLNLRDPERITQFIVGAPPPGAEGGGGPGMLPAPQTPGPAFSQESARGAAPAQSGMSARTPV